MAGVVSAHGHRLRGGATKILDASNNKVNSNMPASHILVFSLSIYLIDLCGSIVRVFDDAADKTDFYMIILPHT